GLSGDYTGRADLMGYFQRVQEQTDGTLRLEPETILASDRHTSMYVRVTATRDGKSLDVTLAEALTVGPDGRWTEFWSLAEDQDAVDAFWD
ncbi:MAG TPA: nuclear transport factor 2 family protein, partial [Actinomycetota bacterium]|nr:nuclear transport factor 2 family protein [Actinomycetota bacterium]